MPVPEAKLRKLRTPHPDFCPVSTSKGLETTTILIWVPQSDSVPYCNALETTFVGGRTLDLVAKTDEDSEQSRISRRSREDTSLVGCATPRKHNTKQEDRNRHGHDALDE